MQIYRVIEDSLHVLTTSDELTALRRFRKAMEKFQAQTDRYAFIEEESI